MSTRSRAQPWFGRGRELLVSLQVRVDLLEAEGRIWQRGQLLETDWELTSRGAGFLFRTFEDFVEWCGFSFTEPWQRQMLGHRRAGPIFVTQRAFAELRTSLVLFGSSAVRVAETGGQIIVDAEEVPTASELVSIWSTPRGLFDAARRPGKTDLVGEMLRQHVFGEWEPVPTEPAWESQPPAPVDVGKHPATKPGSSRVPEQLQHKPGRKRR